MENSTLTKLMLRGMDNEIVKKLEEMTKDRTLKLEIED